MVIAPPADLWAFSIPKILCEADWGRDPAAPTDLSASEPDLQSGCQRGDRPRRPNGGMKSWKWWKILVDLASGYVKIAIENGHRNSWFTIKTGDFP